LDLIFHLMMAGYPMPLRTLLTMQSTHRRSGEKLDGAWLPAAKTGLVRQ
jgi:hypothetical protein